MSETETADKAIQALREAVDEIKQLRKDKDDLRTALEVARIWVAGAHGDDYGQRIRDGDLKAIDAILGRTKP